MLAALQPYVDASISKTVPIPTDCGLDRVQTLFLMAWRAGLKGLTLFRPDQHLDAVMSPETMARASEAPQPACASCP
ncbi:Ribonucleoside-diphosphate reductase NrdZ [compost metagenome]